MHLWWTKVPDSPRTSGICGSQGDGEDVEDFHPPTTWELSKDHVQPTRSTGNAGAPRSVRRARRDGTEWTKMHAEPFSDKAAAKIFIRKFQEAGYIVKHGHYDKRRGTSYSLYICNSHVACPARIRIKQCAETKLFVVERSGDPHSSDALVEWSGRGVPESMREAALMGINSGWSGKVRIMSV